MSGFGKKEKKKREKNLLKLLIVLLEKGLVLFLMGYRGKIVGFGSKETT